MYRCNNLPRCPLATNATSAVLVHPQFRMRLCSLISFQILHLPGHSPGSIALLDRSAGIVATGDTVYATDGELIDWYPPASSVAGMRCSVQRLLEMGDDIRLALPGHNAVLEGADAFRRNCERHLEMASVTERTVRKSMISRPRAKMLLAVNTHLMPVPDFMRDWMTR
jgi:glyoxylase-like metal-dependent hydrolase (beta-lactamase superfamily II)